MLVVDASALAPALADDGQDGDAARARLRAHALTAPKLLDIALVTADARLAKAPGLRCQVDLLD